MPGTFRLFTTVGAFWPWASAVPEWSSAAATTKTVCLISPPRDAAPGSSVDARWYDGASGPATRPERGNAVGQRAEDLRIRTRFVRRGSMSTGRALRGETGGQAVGVAGLSRNPGGDGGWEGTTATAGATAGDADSDVGSLYPFVRSQAVDGEFPLSFLRPEFDNLGA